MNPQNLTHLFLYILINAKEISTPSHLFLRIWYGENAVQLIYESSKSLMPTPYY